MAKLLYEFIEEFFYPNCEVIYKLIYTCNL